jgi:predicted alpha/beta-fold hydrolase
MPGIVTTTWRTLPGSRSEWVGLNSYIGHIGTAMINAAPYKRPALLFNRHLETIYPSLFRKIPAIPCTSTRIATPDDDFLDLDWYTTGGNKLVIISHGLEGNSKRAYVLGMVRAFTALGYDALAWNYRGCSPELNRKPRFYHSGATDDLNTLVDHARSLNRYDEISLVGFSLGGNLTLKYLGEQYPSGRLIHKAVAISTPLDLVSSCDALAKPANWMYVKRFLTSLKRKVIEKSKVMKLPISTDLDAINTLRAFDDQVTAPLHGFRDADDYYKKNSALPYLGHIPNNTLILSALNDPFLSVECYPDKINNSNVTLEFPDHGGHVGFTTFNQNGLYWSELRATSFIAGIHV